MQIKFHSLKSILAPIRGGSLHLVSNHQLDIDVPDLSGSKIKFHSLRQFPKLLKSEAEEAWMTTNQEDVFHLTWRADFQLPKWWLIAHHWQRHIPQKCQFNIKLSWLLYYFILENLLSFLEQRVRNFGSTWKLVLTFKNAEQLPLNLCNLDVPSFFRDYLKSYLCFFISSESLRMNISWILDTLSDKFEVWDFNVC